MQNSFVGLPTTPMLLWYKKSWAGNFWDFLKLKRFLFRGDFLKWCRKLPTSSKTTGSSPLGSCFFDESLGKKNVCFKTSHFRLAHYFSLICLAGTKNGEFMRRFANISNAYYISFVFGITVKRRNSKHIIG